MWRSGAFHLRASRGISPTRAAATTAAARGYGERAARVEALSAPTGDPYPGFLVPPVTVGSLSGDSLTLGDGEAGQVQVVFVFATGCDPCEGSVPAWKAIHAEMRGESRLRVVGLAVDSADATRRYVAEHSLEFPVTTFTDRRLRALYHIRRVPQVLFLDAGGTVRYVRFGALTEPEAVDSVRTAISAALAATTLAVGGLAAPNNVTDTGSQVPR